MSIDFKNDALNNWLEKVLILGVFFILAGLPILQKTSAYHTFFYIFMLSPVVLFFSLKPSATYENISNITKILILFLIWSTISILWTDSQESILSPLKRSIYILSLFLSFSIISLKNKNILLNVFVFSGLTITIISLYGLFLFYMNKENDIRFIGTGALSNPLLSSHLFGIFSVLFMSLAITNKNIGHKAIYLLTALILIIIVITTGSRTPLFALFATSLWVALILRNKKSLVIIISVTIIATLVYILYPEAILNRGLSYRPELWSVAIEKILSQPILGYGFDSNAGFYISSLDITFREPHNIHLSILYFTGIVGFTLWCTMYIYALWVCWKNKTDTLFIIASALLVYGIAAGMTEGGGLLPRPKEHWFITWIPLAFVSALLTNKNLKLKNLLLNVRK